MMQALSSLFSQRFLKHLEGLKTGSLHIVAPDGKTYDFGVADAAPHVNLYVHDWRAVLAATLRGDIGAGESYIEGMWDTDNLENFFQLFLLNAALFENYAVAGFIQNLCFRLFYSLLRQNSLSGSKRNIRAHYDVGNDFYKLWLDRSMTYSSALYAGKADLPLEQAQESKYRRIIDKIKDGASSVLEIGCGWGGFGEISRAMGLKHTGLTISESQYAYAKQRLGGDSDIRLMDYRKSDGLYDSIVSIEMFEAVGEKYWPVFFRTLKERLRKGGQAIIQTITIAESEFNTYRASGDFIRHYTFPGGMLPSLPRFQTEAARIGLKCREFFAFGQDYRKTLLTWLDRFDAHQDDMLTMGFDKAFIRSWRFYLNFCAAAFAVGRTDVVQIELQHI